VGPSTILILKLIYERTGKGTKEEKKERSVGQRRRRKKREKGQCQKKQGE